MTKEEAIKIVRENMHQSYDEGNIFEALKTLVPELSESEDERIRNAISAAICGTTAEKVLEANGVKLVDALAYIEKQKEQKTTPDWMPKFLDELRTKKNYFDWDEHRDIEGQILAIIKWIAPDYFNAKEKDSLHISETCKEKGESFTDAEMDKLIERATMNHEIANEKISKHCAAAIDGCKIEKQKEQKLTELPKSEDYGIDGLYAAVDILQKTLGEVDGYQTDDGILEHKCAISAVKELYEQKPVEWSEEDEENLGKLHRLIIICMGEKKFIPAAEYDKLDNWLKSIRPLPKVEWGEEDEIKLNDVIRLIEDSGLVQSIREHYTTFLKTLPNRFSLNPSWKPSEEQMEAFRIYLYHPQYIGNSEDIRIKLIESLYSDLKKLYNKN